VHAWVCVAYCQLLIFVYLASIRKQSTNHDHHVDVHTTSPPAQVSASQYVLGGGSRPPSPRPSSHNTKHLPASTAAGTATDHDSLKHTLPNDGENSTVCTGDSTAAWRTAANENAIAPVTHQSCIIHSKPIFSTESNNSIHSEIKNVDHPSGSFSRRKNEKIDVLKSDVLPNKPKIFRSTKLSNTSNPIKQVHPLSVHGTKICGNSTVDEKTLPKTTSVLDRRPSTPPPHRPTSGINTRPSTPPPSRMFTY